MALVHDWLTGMRGGERALEAVCELLPHAHLYTLFRFPGAVSPAIERLPIRTSFLQRFPGLKRCYRWFLPLFPLAIERFDLSGYDLILSFSHCVAKGAGSRRGAEVPHLSYCHTPMRYLWDQAPLYFNRERFSRPALIVIERLLERLRAWDRSTHPDRYIASSRFVAGRIRRVWGRESDVIHPPVDTSRFHPRTQAEDFYLVVSALAPYKRLDLAVAACRRLGRKLVVVGTGEERARLERLAGPDVRFLGWRSDAEVADLLGRCRALLFPGEEDFGITPLEAMASGRPVVALGKGGVLETVVNARGAHAGAPTGILFEEPTAEALADAMLELERRERDFDPARLRAHAERFSRPRFLREISEAIERFVAGG